MKYPVLRKRGSTQSLQHPKGRDSESPTPMSSPHGADHRHPDDAAPAAAPAASPRNAMRRVTEHQCMAQRTPSKQHAAGHLASKRTSSRKSVMACPVFHKPARAGSKKAPSIREEAPPPVPEQEEPLISNKAFQRAVYSQARHLYMAEKSTWEPASPRAMARRACGAAMRAVVRSAKNNLAIKKVVETWVTEFRSNKNQGELWQPELEKAPDMVEFLPIREDEDKEGEAILKVLRRTSFSVTKKLTAGITESCKKAGLQIEQLRSAFKTQLDGLEDLTDDIADKLSNTNSIVAKLEAEVAEMRKRLRKASTHTRPERIDEVEEEEDEDEDEDEDDEADKDEDDDESSREDSEASTQLGGMPKDLNKEPAPMSESDIQKQLEKAEQHFCVRPFKMLLARAQSLAELGEVTGEPPEELRPLIAKIRERATAAFAADDDARLQDPLSVLDAKLTRHRLNHSLAGACPGECLSEPFVGLDSKHGRRRSCQPLAGPQSSALRSLIDNKVIRHRCRAWSFQAASPPSTLPGVAEDETGPRGSRRYLLDIVRGTPLGFGVDRMKYRSGACSPQSPSSRVSGSSRRFSRVSPTESQNLGDMQLLSPSLGPPDSQAAPAVESANGVNSISAADVAGVPEDPEEHGTTSMSASISLASALRMMQMLSEEPAEQAREPEPPPAESAQDVEQPRPGREADAPPELHVNFEVDEVDLVPGPPSLSSSSASPRAAMAYSPPPSPGGWPELAEYRSPKGSMTLSTGQELSLPPLPRACRESLSFGAMSPGSLEAVREERRWMATVVPTMAAWKKPQLAPLPPGMKALGPISCRPRDHFSTTSRPGTREGQRMREERPWRRAEAYGQVEEQFVQEETPRAKTALPHNDWCSRHVAVWRTRFGEVEKAISTPPSRSSSKRRTGIATPILPDPRPASNK